MVAFSIDSQKSQKKAAIRWPKLPFFRYAVFSRKCAMWIFCSSLYKLNYLWFDFTSLKFILSLETTIKPPYDTSFLFIISDPNFPRQALAHLCQALISLLVLNCLIIFQTLDLMACDNREK